MDNVKMYRMEGGVKKTANVNPVDVDSWVTTGGWLIDGANDSDQNIAITERRVNDIPVEIERREG